ncbi:hypothetical protein Q1695_003766 [Nippostrongylus brasiliensis]|nr:hypothetical protein Q1695_003766 [Nippostrongylus brasiliensis]
MISVQVWSRANSNVWLEAIALAGLSFEQEDKVLSLGNVPSAGSWLPLDDFYRPVEAIRAVSFRLPRPSPSEELLPAWLFAESEE